MFWWPAHHPKNYQTHLVALLSRRAFPDRRFSCTIPDLLLRASGHWSVPLDAARPSHFDGLQLPSDNDTHPRATIENAKLHGLLCFEGHLTRLGHAQVLQHSDSVDALRVATGHGPTVRPYRLRIRQARQDLSHEKSLKVHALKGEGSQIDVGKINNRVLCRHREESYKVFWQRQHRQINRRSYLWRRPHVNDDDADNIDADRAQDIRWRGQVSNWGGCVAGTPCWSQECRGWVPTWLTYVIVDSSTWDKNINGITWALWWI